MSRLSRLWDRVRAWFWPGREEDENPAPVPTPEPPAPDPEEPAQDAPEWAILPIPIDYAGDWRLTLTGEFRAHAGKRVCRSGPTVRDGLDVFWWSDQLLRFRLFVGRVWFTQCRIGDGSNIGGTSDHYAKTTPILRKLQNGTHVMILDYMRSSMTIRVAVDGQIVADFGFRFEGDRVPPRRDRLYVDRFWGRVTLQQHGGPVIAEAIRP